MQFLDGDLAAQELVGGAPDGAHATTAEPGRRPVTPGDETVLGRATTRITGWCGHRFPSLLGPMAIMPHGAAPQRGARSRDGIDRAGTEGGGGRGNRAGARRGPHAGQFGGGRQPRSTVSNCSRVVSQSDSGPDM
ncbi:hypothetical protein GCM10010278_57150 [Streptomyces melanogenes]|nr:hypothetical protein GCM10010278_57150 [Streptomyces melanogenes]